MKKYVLPIILIFLVLSTIATATQVNEKMGPYSINFSTPADIKTKIEIQDNLETFEGIKYQTYNLTMYEKKNNKVAGSIVITHFNDMVNTNAKDISDSVGYTLVSNHLFTTVESHNREIDNMVGILLTCYLKKDYTNPDMFIWMYDLNNQNKVTCTSFMNWNNDTSEILDTLHVDVIGN